MKFFRKNVNKMIDLNRMWKNIKNNKKLKREVKEVNLDEINLNEYILIDVRSRREFRENHLNGAINIPLPNVKRNIEKNIKNKTRKVLVYCQSGIRSARAVEIMEDLGYTEVYNLKGGIENI